MLLKHPIKQSDDEEMIPPEYGVFFLIIFLMIQIKIYLITSGTLNL